MKRSGILVATISILAFLRLPAVGVAALSPSFDFDDAAWKATDIVVARQFRPETFSVVEAWKGNLRTRAIINVPGVPIAPVEVTDDFGHSLSPAQFVSGERVVLFVCRNVGNTYTPQWLGSHYHSAKVSTSWIEGGQAYAFKQELDPGPTVLVPLGKTELQLKKETQSVVKQQNDFDLVLQDPDANRRANALVRLSGSDVPELVVAAVEALGGCGHPGLVALRELLSQSFQQSGFNIAVGDIAFRAIVRAARADAGKEVTSLLQEQLEYWARVGPKLAAPLWNNWQVLPVGAYPNRYSALEANIETIGRLKYAPAWKTLKSMRKLWTYTPQLNGGVARDPISAACDRALDETPVPASSQPSGS